MHPGINNYRISILEGEMGYFVLLVGEAGTDIIIDLIKRITKKCKNL
jgi:hypothetical protein